MSLGRGTKTKGAEIRLTSTIYFAAYTMSTSDGRAYSSFTSWGCKIPLPNSNAARVSSQTCVKLFRAPSLTLAFGRLGP
ncbi:hypothetical protein B296_00020805 [Ensete ventricosum]|uniref:Uncharacterized protein n=1 Tax=Ensete ventricosum TaxID=4639 RepID=A0A427A3I6_ENSVE|nr:hypothetical protein B296_00020805 [Ensete ventricosum]